MMLPRIKLPKGTTVKTLNGIASFNRIVMNYIRMQTLLNKADDDDEKQPA